VPKLLLYNKAMLVLEEALPLLVKALEGAVHHAVHGNDARPSTAAVR